MGEWSKSIGEKGEFIVNFIFEEILNFNSLQSNQSIECLKGLKHKDPSSNSNKSTHGIDALINYVSPLEDYTLDIGVISSKFTDSEYPKYPVSKFKQYFSDLAYTIECFNNSKKKNSINQLHSGISKTDIIGVLVWLSNKSAINYDIISEISRIQIDETLVFDKIIILDNARVNFLYESIQRSKELYGNENVDFVYHNTGINLSTLQGNSFGKVFPLNYLYSDIIALRTVNRANEILLSLFINDDFGIEKFEQLLGFALSFDQLQSIKRIEMNFQSFDDLLSKSEIREKLSKFSSYKLDENLIVKSFPNTFRN